MQREDVAIHRQKFGELSRSASEGSFLDCAVAHFSVRTKNSFAIY